VRVDDPDDVVYLDALGPCGGDTAGAWTDEGNAHFTRKEYDEAEWCYGQGLGVLAGAGGAGRAW